jgi:oligosaccharide repeat unit polymerase
MYDAPWLPLERVSTLDWLILATGAVAFLVFWCIDYRRWGALSFADYLFGFHYFLKIVVLFPFAWSDNNIVATSQFFGGILEHLDLALYLTAGGVVAMLCGLGVGAWMLSRPPVLCSLVYRNVVQGWCGSGAAVVSVGIVLGLTGLLLALGFQPFVARSLVFERTELRPFYNLWSQIVPHCAAGLVVYGAGWRRPGFVAMGIGVALLGIVGGNRTVAILTLIQVAVILAMPRRFRNLLAVAAGALALASAAILTSLLRADGSASGNAVGTFFFGNDLTDVRDFAWILSGMDDGRWLWGKTYIAGYLSFIPSYLMPFRETYSFGRVSPMLAGLDPTHHSGLRPPIFGEMYVNFGLPGLLIGGFVYGVAVGRVIRWISESLQQPVADRPVPEAVVWSGFLMLQIIDAFVFTPAFFGVYVIVGWLFLGRLMAQLGRRLA